MPLSGYTSPADQGRGSAGPLGGAYSLSLIRALVTSAAGGPPMLERVKLPDSSQSYGVSGTTPEAAVGEGRGLERLALIQLLG